MATFKEITAADIQTTRTALNQLIDVVQNDISASITRRGYAMFVTSSTDSVSSWSVTSSLFQTVHDQDYTLQTANAIFDLTVGLYASGSTVVTSSMGVDTSGKLMFSSATMMMREKVDMYRLHASKLLGDADSPFFAPFDSTTTTDRIDEAIFLDFKRLFARDRIKRESFALRFYQSGVLDGVKAPYAGAWEDSLSTGYSGSNVYFTSVSGAAIFTDVGAATNRRATFGGDVGDIINASDATSKVGLIFYEAGIAVLDAKKVMWGSQHVSGVISAVTGTAAADALVNANVIGSHLPGCNPYAKFIPDFFVSASIDDIVDHVASTRFQSGSYTAVTFQNQTNINSTLLFCRASADEFNYSTNPTFTDNNGNIMVIEDGQEDSQRTFTFPTTVGLYDANNNLLAVAKFSRPIEKSDERDLTVRVRLDF